MIKSNFFLSKIRASGSISCLLQRVLYVCKILSICQFLIPDFAFSVPVSFSERFFAIYYLFFFSWESNSPGFPNSLNKLILLFCLDFFLYSKCGPPPAALVSPGNLLKMQNPRPHPRHLLDQQLHFYKILR